jgi:putative tryptophan/tyrosine transport system substrate-binding protein
MSDMRRRQFITLLGGAAAAWPLAARPQQPAMPMIGFLRSDSQMTSPSLLQRSVVARLCRGRNVAIEYRFAEDRLDPLPELPADLVDRQVAVIVGNLSAELFWEVP